MSNLVDINHSNPIDGHGDGDDVNGDGDNGDSDESDGNGEDEVKPRIVSSQLLKEGPVDGKEPTWAFNKCATFKQRTVSMLIMHSLLNTNTWRSLSVT